MVLEGDMIKYSVADKEPDYFHSSGVLIGDSKRDLAVVKEHFQKMYSYGEISSTLK